MQMRQASPCIESSEGGSAKDNDSSIAISRDRTMSSSGLRPRAPGPLNAASPAAASAEKIESSAATPRDAASLPDFVGSREVSGQEALSGPLQRATSPYDREEKRTAGPALYTISTYSTVFISGESNFTGTPVYKEINNVSTALKARAAEICRRPEVYEQLFFMLRSSQGQLAAACIKQLPPSSYIGLRDATGHTLLHWAALCNESDVMLLLLNAGMAFTFRCAILSNQLRTPFYSLDVLTALLLCLLCRRRRQRAGNRLSADSPYVGCDERQRFCKSVANRARRSSLRAPAQIQSSRSLGGF